MHFLFLFIIFSTISCTSFKTTRRDLAEVTASEQEQNTNSTDLLVVMDINPAVQKMVVSQGGRVLYTFPISSGRGTFDIPTNFNYPPNCSRTPTGEDFRAGLLREYHYSNTWLDRNPETGRYDTGALMRWSVFFTDHGEAMHAASTEQAAIALGPKQDGDTGLGSGGCVRLFPWDARTLFNEIAECKRYETQKVCVEREVLLPSARRNPGGVPACLRMEDKPVCLEYDAPNPNCTAAELAARPGQCQDPQQFRVRRRARQMNVQVIDSRSQAEKDAELAKCRADEEIFNQRKAECIGEKIGMNPHSNRTAFTRAVESLSSARRNQLSYQCNEQLYYEAMRARNSGPSASSAPEATASESTFMRPPRPRRPFRDTRMGRWIRNVFGTGGGAESAPNQ